MQDYMCKDEGFVTRGINISNGWMDGWLDFLSRQQFISFQYDVERT